MLDLIAEHGLRAEQTEQVVVTFPPGAEAALVVTEPRSGLDGRFSVEYAMAVALLDGRLALSRFADQSVGEDAVALLSRISRRVDHGVPSIGEAPEKRFARVEVLTRDGRRLQRTATRVRGAQDLRAKFFDAASGLGRAIRIPDLVLGMRSQENFSALMELLRTPADA